MSKRVIGLVVVVALLAGLLVASQFRSEPLKVSGFVEADEIRVGSLVGGRVKRILAVEGETVEQGELLVEFEPFDLLQQRSEVIAQLAQRQADYTKQTTGYRPEEIAEAKAQAERMKARLEELVNGPRKQEIAASVAERDLAQNQLELAERDYDRVKTLFEKEAATQDAFDKAATNLKVARSTLRVREENLALLKEGTRQEQIAQARAQLEEAQSLWELRKSGYRSEDVAQAKAALEQAEASLAALDERVAELKVTAPVESVVEAVDLREGDLVSAGAPVLSLMDLGKLWVRAYVPENHLDIAVGDTVTVTVDSYPDKTFPAEITFISHQAEFTPGNVQTPEDRSKQVFRIKATITNHQGLLRPGMAADVWLSGR